MATYGNIWQLHYVAICKVFIARQESKQMKTIYIAGPFRGKTPWDVETNIRNAETFGLHVARLNAIPRIPHTMYRFFEGSLPDAFWFEAAMSLLRDCDAILLIPGWQHSSGAMAEKAEAERLGKKVLYSVTEVEEWLGWVVGGPRFPIQAASRSTDVP
jgi:hypothetical protein